MRVFKLIPAIFVFCLASSASAQSKVITLEDIFRNPEVYPEYIDRLQWRANLYDYTFIDNNVLMVSSLEDNTDKSLVTLYMLNNALKAIEGPTLSGFPDYKWIDENSFSFVSFNDLYLFNTSNNSVRLIAQGGIDAENIDIEEKALNMAFTKGDNLFAIINGKEIQITGDSADGVVNGKIVHRNEWGIDKGTFWSPDGKSLAFYHMDESMVTKYPLVEISATPANVEYSRYPMAGMSSHHVTVGVYNTATSKTVFLNTGEPPDQFLTNITWTPDSKFILIAVVNREQNHLQLKQFDAFTGEFVNTILQETDKEYVEPLHNPVFLNNNINQFVWQSPSDGYNHLYLYDLSGKQIRQLTIGQWVVTDFIGIDAEDRYAWFEANAENPTGRDIYKVEIKSGKTIKISTGKGTHTAQFSNDYKYFIDDFTSLETATFVTINDNKGKQVKELLKDKNPLKSYKTGQTKIITLKSNDGNDLYCRMITPPDFDSTGNYPVLIYVYGGPHSQMVTDSWLGGSGMYLNYLSTKGYVIFTMDNRGTSNRGADFEQVIHRNLGVKELEDQKVGIDYLKSLPFIDNDRFAVYGWSYGGFLTISMLLAFPEDFKFGIAGGPVCDWKYYEVMYGERYMDTPQENPDGYFNSSLIEHAADLRTGLLIIHGTMDATVVWQNSLQLLQKYIDNDKHVDYFVYPGHEHNISGLDRMYLYEQIENYLKDKL